jgi:glycerol-3-phosphate cytidylyltransferase
LRDKGLELDDDVSVKVGVTGYVPGVFDMFHIGHLNILRRASERCDRLIAGVVTDDAVESMKGRRPVVPFRERIDIVQSVEFVDEVIIDESPDKRLAWQERRFNVIFKGDDWRETAKGERLQAEVAELGVEVVYLPYTAHTSSTMLRHVLAELARI